MKKMDTEKNELKCSHCGGKIDDLHSMWSRKGYHWCSYLCMWQDTPGTSQPSLKPIMRKGKKR